MTASSIWTVIQRIMKDWRFLKAEVSSEVCVNTAVVLGLGEGSVWLGIGNHTWLSVDVCVNLRKGG